MKVLFVDDEAKVLEGLQRGLYGVAGDWETCFVSSAESALAKLEQERFDVVVSDMRMPRMDGLALLDRVRALHPESLRIVLSGQTDEAASLKLLDVAHQFLAKPCQADTIYRTIAQANELRATLAGPELCALCGATGVLRSPPRIFREVSELLARDDASNAALADLIQQDPALSSKLLQVANSAFFSASARVSDVQQAILRLGRQTLRNLVLALATFGAVNGAETQLSIDDLQRRALATAELASKLAKRRDQASLAYMAGLLCDVGKLLLVTAAPERLRRTLAEVAARGESFDDSERRLFGTTHAELGAALLAQWGLPFTIVQAVARHNALEPPLAERPGIADMAWVAAAIVDGRPVEPALLERWGVGPLGLG